MQIEDFPRRRFLKSTALGVSGLALGGALRGTRVECRATEQVSSFNARTDLYNRLFIMDTWFWKNGLTVAQQNELLIQVSSPRTSECRGNWKEFPQVLETLDRDGIDLIAVYVTLEIDSGDLPPYVNDLMRQLKGLDAFVWIALTSKKYKPSDAAGDKLAIPVLQQAADLVRRAGLQISIYPHFSFWVERNEDALRLVRKTQRDNVGCTFNLYHWLKVEGPDNLEGKAKAVLPHLNCVTINGSRKNASELKVEEGILPLGEGDYDVENFVRTLVRLGYKGPIGLQGYGIGGDIRAKLEKSLQNWRAYCARIEEL